MGPGWFVGPVDPIVIRQMYGKYPQLVHCFQSYCARFVVFFFALEVFSVACVVFVLFPGAQVVA